MKYIKIERDELAGNPRNEWDNLSTFYSVKSSRYMTGGKNDIEFSHREDLEEAIKELRKERAVIVEFSHNCGDQYAVVEESQLQKEYIDYGYSMRKAKYHARRCAEGDIETYKAWAEGDVYGYIVEDEDGERVDSRWGYYGESGRKEAEKEAESIIQWHIEDDAKKQRLAEDLQAEAESLITAM